jgi:hypothetical protein
VFNLYSKECKKVYVIFNTDSGRNTHLVFTSQEKAEKYKEKSNRTWSITHETTLDEEN